MSNVKISIIYDSQLHDKNLKSGWGFSCLIEHSGKKILFDTGDNPEKLAFNLSYLGINPGDFNAIVLSHNHWDHTGGLRAVLGKNKDCKLYFGKSFPASFQKTVEAQGGGFVKVQDLCSLAEGIFVGPEMGALLLREIPLALQTGKGLVIITGCAHPGILEMVKTIKEKLNQNIYLILGGFHLGMSLRLNAIVKELKAIGVEKVAPCHCSGKKAIALFNKEFQEDFIAVGGGLTIEV